MNDAVRNPSHYQTPSGLEAIDVIEAFFPDNFYFANAFKYIARAGKKDDIVEDIEKAIWYLQRFLDTQVRYSLTKKGEEIVKLLEAGFSIPDSHTVAFEESTPVYGYTAILNDGGIWVDEFGYMHTTESIIENLKRGDGRLIGVDEEDDD
ncbi:DUF3310 domain-containing protein [Corynebacterium guaraldiae]|uniref:DUF3310 domain-containing protein n=1 Tax=Corynebacterium guaraldiae TaxID=3051103 RepID=UPI0011788A73|nr:DUF3310 domain-containing protein [Corynebacterium guaraldiae]TRX43716.1 DUF3310 domain-containing protein [Corynebacterium guaraldiae]